MVGGDENAARDVGQFIAAVDGLRAGDAAIVVHHAGHQSDRERGSSALGGAADLRVSVKRPRRGPLTLACEKLKDAPEWEPLTLVLDPVGDSCVLSLVVGAEAARDDLGDAVLHVLEDADGPLSKNEVTRRAGKRKQDVHAALEVLERAGHARSTPDGWIAVPEAREPHGNRTPAIPADSGSGPGGNPVGVPGREPPGDDQFPKTGNDLGDEERAA
jgi:hypothetical protein